MSVHKVALEFKLLTRSTTAVFFLPLLKLPLVFFFFFFFFSSPIIDDGVAVFRFVPEERRTEMKIIVALLL